MFFKNFSFILLLILMFCIDSNGQEIKKVQFFFQDKNEILEWCDKEFGYCMDTMSIKIEDKDIFLLFADYASGLRKQTLFMFLKDTEKEEGMWWFFCMRDTMTGKINIELDQEDKEIIFKSVLGKTLMVIPFEVLSWKQM